MNSESKISPALSSILANGKSANHEHEIRQAIKASGDIFLSVAFLKNSGLELIADDLREALDRGCKLTAVIGLDFYLTDPTALDVFSRFQDKYQQCRFFLFRPQPSFTYHPKFYRFRMPDGLTVIVGSANLTGGGLSKNVEISMVCRAPHASALANDAVAFEKAILEHPRCFSPTFHDLLLYQREHSIYRKAQQKANRTAKKAIDQLVKLDSVALSEHLKLYRASADERADLKKRQVNYNEARTILTEKIGNAADFTAAEFRQHYERLVGRRGEDRLWHSGSLYRQRNHVIPRHAVFQQMVRKIRERLGAPPSEMFEIGEMWRKQIPHLGPNVFTEICNTLRPDLYAVLNKNPTGSLQALGRGAFPSPTMFTSDEYARYCKILADLRDACGFKDFGETDHFLNYVYWKTKGTTDRDA